MGPTGGGSDDIGDVRWNVPTVTLRFPSNIPGGPGHNWANGIAMATPIAHKGVVAGAKVQAMTMLDILLHPELVAKAWDYFKNVQTKDVKYKSFLRPDDKPAIWLNKETMEKYPSADEEDVLRCRQVRHVSGTARHQVPDGAVRIIWATDKYGSKQAYLSSLLIQIRWHGNLVGSVSGNGSVPVSA